MSLQKLLTEYYQIEDEECCDCDEKDDEEIDESSLDLHSAVKKIFDPLIKKIELVVDVPKHGYGKYNQKENLFDGLHLFRNENVDAFMTFQLKEMSEDDKKTLIKIIDDFKKTFKGSTVFSSNVIVRKDSNWIVVGFTQK
jgi:hypothetical protein